jgi:hypothetical protein
MLLLALACPLAALQGTRAADYVDPKLLEVPWGNYSFIRQGWRGYLETVPAARFRDGLGIVWNQTPPHRTVDQVAAELAWAGFRRVRLEIPWGSVKWDESGLETADATRMAEILRALKAHGLRPLILLNANHLQPCPVRWHDVRLQRAASADSRTLQVTGDVSGLADGTPTLMTLATGTAAGPLIEGARAAGAAGSYELTLAKPAGRELAPGTPLRIAVLRYPPLYPAGTPEYERTTAGWLRYVKLVMQLVTREYGSSSFDVEVWNELTFGSAFLEVDNYRTPAAARTARFLHPGGSAWELAHSTRALLEQSYPDVKVIWGFSNTTFFEVHVAELPARFDGQSYHPYGTARRCYADLVRGRADLLLDGYVPSGCVVQPEGYAQGWQQTESLLRFIAPAARSAHPPGSTSFAHFMTEHGLAPAEIGIEQATEAQQAKAGFVLRAPLLWLNKGMDALYVFDLYDPKDSGFGMLRGDGTAGTALQALHRLTAAFADARPHPAPRALTVQVVREGAPAGILGGDPQGEHLPQEQAAAILPFQLDDHRFVVAAYVMTQDFPATLAPQPYQITIGGVRSQDVAVSYYAPDTGLVQPLTVKPASPSSVTLRLSLTGIPRLIQITEGPVSGGTT